MANIFISWSKSKSRALALETKKIIESLAPNFQVFVSEDDILAGEKIQDKIIEKIRECDYLLLCFTKENKKSPWLLFEAGFASGLSKIVIPFLFDNDPYWHSWIDNPMNIAHEININSENFEIEFIKCFSLSNTPYVRDILSRYVENIEKIKDEYRQIDVKCEDFIDLLVSNDKFRVESPRYENKTAYFLTGFETFELWKSIIDSFLFTGKFLWIYGRKNMKLFGNNFNYLFDFLKEKSENENMSGIDFRCLFLNPNSAEVKYAHKQQDIFYQELDATIKRAKHQIGNNQNFQKCFKMYSNRREEVIIRLDNCIIYSKPHFDENGCPQIMTNSNFEVFSASSQRGKECIRKFEDVWNSSTDLFSSK